MEVTAATQATVVHAAMVLLEALVAHQRVRPRSQERLDGVLEAHMPQVEVGITEAATETSVLVVHAWVLVLVLVWTAVHSQEVLLLEVYWEPALQGL